MSTVPKIRAVDMCMSDAMPFHQHWEVKTEFPIDELLHDRAFADMRHQLRAGDRISVVRYADKDMATVKEIGEMRVVECTEDAVRTVLMQEIVKVVPDEKPVKPEAYAHPLFIQGTLGDFRVEDAAGKVIESQLKTRKEAEDLILSYG